MYKQLKKKKWKFLGGGGMPEDPNLTPEILALQMQLKEAQEKIALLTNQKAATGQTDPPQLPVVDSAATTKAAEEIAKQFKKEDSDSDDKSKNPFGAADYIAGATTALQGLGNANADGEITAQEGVGVGLDAGVAMSGPYGQIAGALGTAAEGLMGDSAYQGMGEGVEYEKTGSIAVKNGLKGAALGAKIGSSAGPLGTALGAGAGLVGGALTSVIGAGKRKRDAQKEFVKRRDERITNMNQQSKAIYADQYQSYYRKGGKAIQSYLKLK